MWVNFPFALPCGSHIHTYCMPCAFYVTIDAATQVEFINSTDRPYTRLMMFYSSVFTSVAGIITNKLLCMTTHTIHDTALTNRFVCLCMRACITTPIHSYEAADSVVSKTMRVPAHWMNIWMCEKLHGKLKERVIQWPRYVHLYTYVHAYARRWTTNNAHIANISTYRRQIVLFRIITRRE